MMSNNEILEIKALFKEKFVLMEIIYSDTMLKKYFT